MAAKAIYVIKKADVNSIDVHSMISRYFGRGDGSLPSAENNGSYAVIASALPDSLSSVAGRMDVNLPSDEAREVVLESVVCFHRKPKFLPSDDDASKRKKAITCYLTVSQALVKFAEKSGLRVLENLSDANLLKRSSPHGPITNVFHISGKFEIINRDLLNKALLDGIGSKMNYGFGLVLAKSYS